MTTSSLTPDLEVDIIAVGSGMGASCAALAAQAQGLETVILEKSDVYGGGTTYSYGIIWVGDNHLEQSLGIKDSREDAYDYLHHLAAVNVGLSLRFLIDCCGIGHCRLLLALVHGCCMICEFPAN